MEYEPSEGVAIHLGRRLFSLVKVLNISVIFLTVALHMVFGGHFLLIVKVVPGGPADGGAWSLVHVQMEGVFAVAESLCLTCRQQTAKHQICIMAKKHNVDNGRGLEVHTTTKGTFFEVW